MHAEIKDLTFGYVPEEPTIQNINLDISDPGLYCIIGPNGVGKSTLVKCMVKLLTPDSGTVVLDGDDVCKMSFKDLAKVAGYIPVKNEDSFSKTVFETVLMGRFPYQKWKTSEEDYRITAETIETVGIQHLSMRETSELSAGQFQRVTIARGLAQKPGILILDEPTANLDPRYQITMTRLLKRMADDEGIIVLMISHDLNIAARFADKVILMTEPGIIQSFGTPQEVITEESISEAYSVSCEIIQVRGRPHVILLDEIGEDPEN